MVEERKLARKKHMAEQEQQTPGSGLKAAEKMHLNIMQLNWITQFMSAQHSVWPLQGADSTFNLKETVSFPSIFI